ncbi:uncharacterized protein N7477_005314 [Penicillium maclennaniae]|uniref:uncharacterized protein n=1 Tax=Penicillium maclennaniae TaxID=1343394 RepID=UPI002540A892|nr:uncharacterized protein N7477_005314 [Penicillium maclennaniae]KAJ5669951.1 hypothetical protein N7477_005314 [Penicillium maclennaniae]
MRENTLTAVIIGFLMALILIACAGWFIAKFRVKRAFKADRELTQDTEKGLKHTHIPKNNKRGWVRPPRKETIISRPNYVLFTDGDGRRIRRGCRLAQVQKVSPKHQKQTQNESKIDGPGNQNKGNKQYSKDEKKDDQKNEDKKNEDKKNEDKKNEDKENEDKKNEDKKNEDKKDEDKKSEDKKRADKKSADKKSEDKNSENNDDQKTSSQNRPANQKVEKKDSWGVWESVIEAKPDDQKKSGSNKGNQENQGHSKWNEQNDWSFGNHKKQDNHDQCHWDEQNQWNYGRYGDQYNQDQDNWQQNQCNGDNENDQKNYYHNWESRNDDNYNKWNSENDQKNYYHNWESRNDDDYNKWNSQLGPEDSISNQKRKTNGGDRYRHGKRNNRSHRVSANKTLANNRNEIHRNSRMGWSSKHKRGLPPSDQGKSKHDKPKSDRSKNYDNAMNSQVPMDDQKKNEGKVLPEKW